MRIKKIIALILALTAVCLFASCKKTEQNEETTSAEKTENETETFIFEGETLNTVENTDEMKLLIAYFDVNGKVEDAADLIADKTEGEIFEIKTANDYKTAEGLLKEEIIGNVHPVISDRVENMEEYDAVFLGFPAVEGRLPMAAVSFIEEYDLRDKVIIPFCLCSDGEDLSQVTAQLDAYCFGASQTLMIDFSDENAKDKITQSLENLGF